MAAARSRLMFLLVLAAVVLPVEFLALQEVRTRDEAIEAWRSRHPVLSSVGLNDIRYLHGRLRADVLASLPAAEKARLWAQHLTDALKAPLTPSQHLVVERGLSLVSESLFDRSQRDTHVDDMASLDSEIHAAFSGDRALARAIFADFSDSRLVAGSRLRFGAVLARIRAGLAGTLVVKCASGTDGSVEYCCDCSTESDWCNWTPTEPDNPCTSGGCSCHLDPSECGTFDWYDCDGVCYSDTLYCSGLDIWPDCNNSAF